MLAFLPSVLRTEPALIRRALSSATPRYIPGARLKGRGAHVRDLQTSARLSIRREYAHRTARHRRSGSAYQAQ